MNTDPSKLPSKLATRILSWLIRDDLKEEVLGDLEEQFLAVAKNKSPLRAQLNYWFQVLNYCRPFAISKPFRHSNHMRLLNNYFKVALRLFKKEKTYTLINIIGLAFGITCSLFIYIWVQDEVQFNAFLKDGNRVCNVLNLETQTNGELKTYQYSSYKLKKVLEEKYPIIEDATMLSNGNWMAFQVGDNLIEWQGVDATPEFFNVFEVIFPKGSPQKMFSDPNTLAISEDVAEVYFGENWILENVIGTSMKNDEGETFELVGVYKNLPKHSTLQCDFVVPFANRLKKRPNLDSWQNSSSQLYVKLQKNIPITQASLALENAINDHRSGDFLTTREIFLQPFEEMYLYNRYENGSITGGRIDYIRLLSIAALFVLLLASINFMNLTTARAARRAKETGVRKVLGALRQHLKVQFLLESVLISTFAVAISLLIIALLLPQFEQLTHKEFDLSFSWKHLAIILLFILFQGILSGIYPAMFLASMKTISSLKAAQSLPTKHNGFRKALVVFQFTITLVMLIGALTVYEQVTYIQTKNIGLDRSNLIRSYSYDMNPNMDYHTYKTELLSRPGIENVTIVNQLLIDIRNATSGVSWDGKLETDELEFYHMDANPDFIPTMKIELKEGRNFDWDIQSDTNNYIINETAQHMMGITNPVGKRLSMWGAKGKIVGVVRDFHNASLHSAIEPIIIRNKMHNSWMILARTKPGMNQEAVESLEEVFWTFNPNRTFWYRFLDDLYDAQYKSELMVKDLSWYFTILSIVISLLGLYALVAYSAERKIKEVGIRKVLGASLLNILKLLSKEYIGLLAIAMLLAFPIGYWVMSRWLDGFVYSIELAWWLFAIAAVITFLLALLIIGIKTSKLAISNPINHLRDE